MPDSYTEYSRTSWFGNIGNSIGGALFGALLGIIAVPLLFWNEGHAVKVAKGLEEARKSVVEVDPAAVRPENEGKLIYFTGNAETDETLGDSNLGVSAPALKLQRNVVLYQWKEEKQTSQEKQLGGGTTTKTTYTYKKEWSPSVIKSSEFHHPEGHANPPTIAIDPKTQTWEAGKAHVAAFKLPAGILDQLSASEALPVTDEALNKLPPNLKSRAKLAENGFYLGNDPGSPEVGDEKVTYQVLRPTVISVMARQTGSTLAPYEAKSGSKVEIADIGTIPASALVAQKESENKIFTWILRGLGFMFLFIAFASLIRPLGAIANVIPFVGSIVEFGAGIFAFVSAVISTAVIVAIAWFVYRPLLSIGLAAGIVAIIVIVHRSRPSRKAAPLPPAAA